MWSCKMCFLALYFWIINLCIKMCCSCLFEKFSLHCVVTSMHVAVCASTSIPLISALGSVVRTHQILMGLLGINPPSLGFPYSALGDQGFFHFVLARNGFLLLFLCILLFSLFYFTSTQLYQCHAPALSSNFQHLDYRLQVNIDSILMCLFIQEIVY